jgi:hypothetical protein
MSRTHLTPAEQRQAKLQRQHQANLRRLAKSNEQKQSLKRSVVRRDAEEEEVEDG